MKRCLRQAHHGPMHSEAEDASVKTNTIAWLGMKCHLMKLQGVMYKGRSQQLKVFSVSECFDSVCGTHGVQN